MRGRLGFLVLRGAVAALGALPEPAMRRLGRWTGLVWYLVDPARRRMAQRHMRRVGEPPSHAKEVFGSYGRYWAESFWVRPRRVPELKRNLTVDGIENLRAAVAGNRGVVVVLPHLGNWEVAALIARDLDLPVVAVAENLSNPRITEWFTAQRAMFGIEIVLTGGGGVTRQLLECLNQGKAVCLLADRDVTGRGIEVEFFGERTTLPGGPVVLARRTGLPVLPVAIYFEEGSGHHAIIQPPVDFPPGAELADEAQIVAHHLEALIRRDPGQWHLVQPNWPSDRA